MFGHIYKNHFLTSIRNKLIIFWTLLFPIGLSILFKVAFGNIYESSELFKTVPVAVVIEEKTELSDNFKIVADNLSEADNEDRLLDVTYADEDEAMELLKNEDVYGIIYAGEKVTLTLSSDISDANISQSILKSLVEEYNLNYKALLDVAKTNPQHLEKTLGILTEDTNYNKEVSYSNGNMDVYVQYFSNLLAMACLYAALAGMEVALGNQANLTHIGARKNISPVPKSLSTFAELLACITVQFLCLIIALLFMIFALKIDFGVNIPYMMLTILVGCICGVSLGFLIGSISHFKEGIKIGILICVSMLCSFFSGLMVGDMYARVEAACPIINRINPAALISNCFYSLNIYDTYTKYTTNIITLLIISAVFCIGGFLISRREKYASL